jgi:F-type H+-transporting ATPase subunit alpha
MKKVAGPLKLDLAQYRSLAAFAQFASDLDKATRDQLTRGEKLSEVIKQPQYQPLQVERQVIILYAATRGALDDIPTPRVSEFETGLYRYLETEHPKIVEELARTQALSDEVAKGLDEALTAYRRDVFGIEAPAGQAATPASKGGSSGAGSTPEATADATASTTTPAGGAAAAEGASVEADAGADATPAQPAAAGAPDAATGDTTSGTATDGSAGRGQPG